MSAIGSKLLMCVCAGATGATVVPLVKHSSASVHRRTPASHRAAPGNSTPLPVLCAPLVADAVVEEPLANAAPALAQMADVAS